jgi:hypothetical protein
MRYEEVVAAEEDEPLPARILIRNSRWLLCAVFVPRFPAMVDTIAVVDTSELLITRKLLNRRQP